MVNSDLSFGSVCDQMPMTAPAHSSGKQSPSTQRQTLEQFSVFDALVDLDTSPSSSIRLSETMHRDLISDSPIQGISKLWIIHLLLDHFQDNFRVVCIFCEDKSFVEVLNILCHIRLACMHPTMS